ncbi:MAG: hypothetical protein BMS9Abin02_1261 [Anaerolineae bacterium]|nr:MAG: hypothetical protein BMS9Abin02_1261 [Anaerolineae bacterium]
MVMERLHTDGHIGQQVVGGVHKLNTKRGELSARNGVKKSEQMTNSFLGVNKTGYTKPWWETIAEQFRLNRIQLGGWNRKQPVVDLLDLLAENLELGPLTAVLGKDGDGRSIQINFSNQGVHNVLVAGDQGSGKSNLIRSLLLGLAINNDQRHLQMLIVEPRAGHARWGAHGNGYQLLGSLPHALAPIATSRRDVRAAISLLEKEVDFRKENSLDRPLIFLVLDDFDRLLGEIDPALKYKLIRLLQESSGIGIRVILALRGHPGPEFLPIVRSNFPVRLIGRIRNKGLLRQLTGPDQLQINELESALPTSGAGRFVAIGHDRTVPFNAAYIDDYDTYTVATTLIRQKRPTIIAWPAGGNINEAQEPEDLALEIETCDSAHNLLNHDTPPSQDAPNLPDWEYASREMLEIFSPADEDSFE